MRRDWLGLLLIVLLPLADLAWNLAHLNIGLVDFYGLSAFAQGFAINGAWPATPYFPAGYPLLLIPFGHLGSTLVGGYILSAFGMMLALYACWMLARQMGAGRPASVAAVLLCWLAPVCRVVSGSPSVDALYTGLGMWFLAAAITVWRDSSRNHAAGQGGLQRWAQLGLLLPTLLLPLLRYHAVILLIPVLVVLAIARRCTRTALIAILAVVLAISFNYATYYYAYREALPSVAGIQVFTGLELSYYRLYEGGSESLWKDYPRFCELARHSSILKIYTPLEVARSWIRNWLMFLRQPSVVLLCVILACAAGFRRPLPRGAALGLAWITAYTLVLAVTYYTARSAALPVMLATVLGLATVQYIAAARTRSWITMLAVALLSFGFLAASGFAKVDYRHRQVWAGNSRWLDLIAQVHHAHPPDIAVADWRLLPLRNNAWASPYVTLTASWIDDPEIRASQRLALRTIATADLVSQHPAVRYVAVVNALGADPNASGDVFAVLSHSPQWRVIARTQNSSGTYTCVYALREGITPAAGAAPAGP